MSLFTSRSIAKAIALAAGSQLASAVYAFDTCPQHMIQTGESYSFMSFVVFSVNPDGGASCQPKVAYARRVAASWNARATPGADTLGCNYNVDAGSADSDCLQRPLSYPLPSENLATEAPGGGFGDMPWRPDVGVYAGLGVIPYQSAEPRWHPSAVLGPRFWTITVAEERRDKFYWPAVDMCGCCTCIPPVVQDKEEATDAISVEEVAYDIVGGGNIGATVDLSFLVRYRAERSRAEFCPDPLVDYITGGAVHAQRVVVTAHMADASTQTWVAFDGRVSFNDGNASNDLDAVSPTLDFADLTDMFPSEYEVSSDCLVSDPQSDYVMTGTDEASGGTSHYFEGEVCRVVIRREYGVNGGASVPPTFSCGLPGSEDQPCGREECDPLPPQCPPCAADYNGDGGVDGADLAAFFADFEAGLPCADVDGNGGVDGVDLATFFALFQAGGCE